MVAALLGETPSVLRDVPEISDVNVVTGDARGLRRRRSTETAAGRAAPRPERGRARRTSRRSTRTPGSSRIPILFCGPLLHRLGEALIPDLGGCRIGDRPINFHLDALRAFGAIVDKSYEGIRLTAPERAARREHRAAVPERRRHRAGAAHRGARRRASPSCANAAIEPEIMDLIAILQKMGAIITVEPNRVILIEGVDKLDGLRPPLRSSTATRPRAGPPPRSRPTATSSSRGAKQQEMHDVPQRLPQGRRRVRHPRGRHPVLPPAAATLKPVVDRDRRAPRLHDRLAAAAHRRPDPGRRARSIVHETVYENRFGFTEALVEMGADIVVHREGIASVDRRVPRRALEQAAVITGPTPLHGADIEVPDLRGGFSHLIAALAAEGTSTVQQRRHHQPRLRALHRQARARSARTSTSRAETACRWRRRAPARRPSAWRFLAGRRSSRS